MPTPATRPNRLIILGCTGSIGTQTIRVLEGFARAGSGREGHRSETGATEALSYEIVGLAAGRNASMLFEQAAALGVKDLALCEPGESMLDAPSGVRLRTGGDAAERLVREVEADVVMAAIVGSAGLPATLAAIELGRTVLLANKETLVAAGEIVIAAAQRSGARLLPVDSEHAAVWQALASRATRAEGQAPGGAHGPAGDERFDPASPAPLRPPFTVGADVARITLTASGGALRDWPIERIAEATPEEALAHPNWDMGAKVTIDTASLMNKAFELVEARWLFGVLSDRLAAVVHPQSIVHAIVDFVDGSSVAQIGAPSMLTPIQYALSFPARVPGLVPAARLGGLGGVGRLDFVEPDPQRYPALALGFDMIDRAGTAGAIVNAANEAAIEAFLDRRISFGQIYTLTRAALESLAPTKPAALRDLDEALEADREARRWVSASLADGVH